MKPDRTSLASKSSSGLRKRRWFLAGFALVALPVLGAFSIISITRNGSDVTVTFEASQGVTYQLQRKPDLGTSAWHSISGVADVVAASNGPARVTDSAGSLLPQAFYRVNASRGFFVDTVLGNDGNPGTRVAPKKTISAGIAAASATIPASDVYVSKGLYNESVTLSNGVSLYGGYDAAADWSRSTNNTTTIASPAPIGIIGSGLNAALTVEQFHVTAANAASNAPNGDGRSSYGVVILNSPGGVTLRQMSITAGNGTMGLAGSNGVVGLPGTNGGNANGQVMGFGGASPCGATGGDGGFGAGGVQQGAPGLPGTNGIGGGSGAPGGARGAAGSCSTTSSSNGGSAAPVSTNGSPGFSGAGGAPAAPLGALNAAGIYLPPSGGVGAGGTPGGGGGGGGSGGGTAHGHNTFCTDCSAHWGGGGGGGGGGSCGGTAGEGGRGGGGSFAVVIVASVVTIDSTKLTAGNGGKGGNGGDGGAGGTPGGGGTGASGQCHTDCNTRCGGNGANGSAGGAGGKGGGGAGGSGGPSIGIFYKGIAPVTNGVSFVNGIAGQGGNGGQGAVQASSGATGSSGTVVLSN